ncbi:AzlD domain-containing protein [Nocardioides plantarum]|uniref:AzlD domain-containing protein n=1 Tax=Nocardioides plantarum TaxID=29299 RepID=A0ABV5KFD4_9ACTN|nr:AzlD domain-containing protein [Nocardioides plantarum]
MNLSEGQVWLLIGALAVMAAATKAIGPALVGGRELPTWATGVIATMAPPLLAALIATAVFADERRLAVGADTAGVAVATLLLLCRVPLVVSAAAAVGVTALLRAAL